MQRKQNTKICIGRGTLRQPSTLRVCQCHPMGAKEQGLCLEPSSLSHMVRRQHEVPSNRLRDVTLPSNFRSSLSLRAGSPATTSAIAKHTAAFQSIHWLGRVFVLCSGLVWFGLIWTRSGNVAEDNAELLILSCLYLPDTGIAGMCHHTGLGQHLLEISSNRQ